MASEVIGIKKGFLIDHINRKPLDNRRVNLRHVTFQQNCWNSSVMRRSKTKLKGIKKRSDCRLRPWCVEINENGRRICVGFYKTRNEAIRAYNEKVISLHGEYAVLNKERKKRKDAVMKEIGEM